MKLWSKNYYQSLVNYSIFGLPRSRSQARVTQALRSHAANHAARRAWGRGACVTPAERIHFVP